eukprot:EG_transcript_10984
MPTFSRLATDPKLGMQLPTLAGTVLLAVIAGVWRFVFCSRPTGTISMAAVASEPVEYSTIKFPPLINDRLLRAVRGEPVDRIPIWVMRQAGRYLPEYRQFMAGKEFFQVCRNPKQVAELTLQPVLRYNLDASIIFSDILVIPQALGCSITLHPEKGPVFKEPVDSTAAWHKMQDDLLNGLGIPMPGATSSEKNAAIIANVSKLVSPSLDYVYDAITETRMQLNGRVPLLGFCGAPMTLAIYMIEGGGSRTFAKSSRLMNGDPQTAHELLAVLAHMCAHYLINQVKAGAQALQVFDSYAGALSPDIWREFSLPYMRLIAEIIKKEFPQMPTICFAKDAHYGLNDLADTPYDVIALDSSVDLGSCHRQMAAKGKAIQGNFDPTVLYAPPEKISAIVGEELKKSFGGSVPTKYIANMGHGMSPDHDPVHLGAFIDAVHAFGQK